MATTEKTLRPWLVCSTEPAVIESYIMAEEIADQSDFDEFDNNVVVVDTEATGLSFEKDDLIQIAAAKIQGGKIVDWYVTFVDPGHFISEEITHLTHISNADVVGAPTPDGAVAGLVEFCGNAIMVAHNVGFDKTFLTSYESGKPLLNNIWVDTLELAHIAFPRLTSYRLIDLAHAFGFIESTHRADDDVATTCILLRTCLAQLSTFPYALLKNIADLSDTDVWSTGYSFNYLAEKSKIENPEQMFDTNGFSMLKSMRAKATHNLVHKDKHDVEIDEQIGFAEDAIAATSLQFSPEEQISAELAEGGMLSKIYADYEVRPQQQEMSVAINDAFSKSENVVIEAGTGVGKSMAYLIPAISVAQQNDITIGISTKSNVLLDQLVYHELPALKKQIPDLTYSALKGASHYICLRKAAILANHPARNIKYKDKEFCNAESVARLLSYIYQTTYDDADSLKVNGRALFKPEYTTKSHQCLRRKCAFYRNGCFVHGARRFAKNSDIVVTNHSLTLCDVKADNAILPPIRYWVIDEAHGLEDTARQTYAKAVSAATLFEVSRNLNSVDPRKNVFARVQKNITEQTLVSKEEADMSSSEESEWKNTMFGISKRCISLGGDLAQKSSLLANNISLFADFAPRRKGGYNRADIWLNAKIRESEQFNALYQYAKDFTTQAEDLLNSVNNLIAYMDSYKSTEISQIELGAFVFEVKEVLDALDLIFFNSSEEFVYSANVNLEGDTKLDKILAEPISVATPLVEGLFSRSKSVVMTSATLAIGKSFDVFLNTVGLDKAVTPTLQLRSHFNYDDNMIVYIPNDIEPPNGDSALYLRQLQKFLIQLHIASNGSILNLFTNRREMESCYNEAYTELERAGLRAILQKYTTNAKSIRDEFIADKTVSLFALKSFWEGFDAPGDTLRGVVISRLPFTRPTDPLSQERQARDSSSWFRYTLPEAVIEIKQAVGRLIRKSSDKGFVVLCDRRLETKYNSYGKSFIDSLPTTNVVMMSMEEIVRDVADGANNIA